MARETLPVPLMPLLGREQEIEALCALLQRPGVRLVTVMGSAGVGKTALALSASATLCEPFPDGVYLVSLAELHEPQLVLPTLAQTLVIHVEQHRPLLEALHAALSERRCLLLLDNFEQVVASAPLLVELLEGCPLLSMLVTSREVMRVRGEHVFRLLPLPLPDLTSPLDALARNAAVQIFVKGVQCFQPSFQLAESNMQVISEICARLDGLPLALELAAARCRLLSPQELLERLERRLQVLTYGLRDLPERQQTLRSALDWSYELLSPAEQRLFCSISIFEGSCTLDMIEQICEGEANVLDGVTALLEKSLLMKSEGRLFMLETLREYGRERLEVNDEYPRMQHIHASYYLRLAEKASPRLRGAEALQWLEQLELEHTNLQAVLSWGLASGEMMVQALRLGCALERFWVQRGYSRAGYTWMTQLLSRSEGIVQAVRAQALLVAGRLAYYAYEQRQCENLCEESLQIFRAMDDTAGMAVTLKELGCLAAQRGRRAEARELLTESVVLYQRADDQQGCAEAMLCLAEVLHQLVENMEARALAEESLHHFRREGDSRGMAKAQALLAFVAAYFQEHRQALALAEESLTCFHEIDDRWEVAAQLRSVAELALRQNEIEQARVRAEESLRFGHSIGHREAIAGALYLLAQIHQRRGSSQQASELFEQSRALYQELGNQEGVALILHAQAHTAFYRRDYDMARRLHEQALCILLTCEHRPALIQSLIELSRVVAVQGQVIWATRLLGASDTLRKAIGRKPTTPQDAYRRVMAISSMPLSEQNFMDAWKEGCTMTPQEAFDAQNRLRSFAPHLRRRERRIPPPLHLTGRETEVLRLMTTGLTNPQIAAQLTISPVTVNTHVRSIYNKMGVASRSAATRYALEHHLI